MPTILVIDDDEVSRLAAGAALEAAEHEVHYAPNGEVGLEFYQRAPTDAVIVDLAMPVMNGLKTIRELTDRFPDVKIIAVSGVSPDQLPVAEEYGALRTLVKPLDATELQQAVASVLRQSTGWEGVVD
jgi:CheY-like chemotaxis protein